MPISAEKRERAIAALAMLRAIREDYKDVLVVLDFVTLLDIANHEIDSDAENAIAGNVLSEEALAGVLWRLGKYANSTETSHELLPAMIQYALDEQERKEAQ